MEIKIDKDIPIPTTSGKYAIFDKMGVGDSVAVPYEKANLYRYHITYYNRKYRKKKFITRGLTEKGKKVMRIWRTK